MYHQQNSVTLSASTGAHLARELKNKRVLDRIARDHTFVATFSLPQRVAVHAMSYLTPDELGTLACSCRFFNDSLESAAKQQAKTIYCHPLPPRRAGESFSELLQFLSVITKQRRIDAGCAHSLVVSAKGVVLSFGYGQAGRTGLGCRNVNTPTPVKQFERIRVSAVSAGGAHSLVVTGSGTLYSFGGGECGKLGHGDEVSVFQPKVVSSLFGERITAISANDTHSVVADAKGAVYSFGFGRNGRLGHGDESNQLNPKKIATLNGQRITSVSAGAQSSFALSNKGGAWSCGYGADGQLGHGEDLEDQLKPKILSAFCGTEVAMVSVGDRHTLLVTAAGLLYSFGTGESGQLGVREGGRTLNPKPVAATQGMKVVRIAAGLKHSLIITDNGSTYAFGDGACGQLGTGEAQTELVPRKLDLPNDVSDCATYSHHSLVSTASGDLISFGSGGGGVLGHGDERLQLAPKVVAAVRV
jgi:alpha-tubulin suppressor-like RCC1 family protein